MVWIRLFGICSVSTILTGTGIPDAGTFPFIVLFIVEITGPAALTRKLPWLEDNIPAELLVTVQVSTMDASRPSVMLLALWLTVTDDMVALADSGNMLITNSNNNQEI